jgi:hypothetical protein
MAKMWLIARFDDEGQTKLLRQQTSILRQRGEIGFTMLDDDHPIVKNSEKLDDYCYLLSLLVHSQEEDYFGQTIRPWLSLWSAIILMWRGVKLYIQGVRDGDIEWTVYPCAIDGIVDVARALEIAFIEGQTEKLLYIGGILKIAHQSGDTKIRLVMLTSILELLLTHNPNYARFNVEDSINKQFQLKASILIYLNDRTRNIEAIRNRLKVIYEQRSNIAHGNFNEFDKFLRKLSKKEGQEEYFDDLIKDLYTYLGAVLEEYLKDRRFVEFLKDG